MTDFWADRCAKANNFEEALSAISLGCGQLERQESVSPEDLARIRSVIMRLAQAEWNLTPNPHERVTYQSTNGEAK